MNRRLASLQRWYERLSSAPYYDRDLINYVQLEIRRLQTQPDDASQFFEPAPENTAPSPFTTWS